MSISAIFPTRVWTLLDFNDPIEINTGNTGQAFLSRDIEMKKRASVASVKKKTNRNKQSYLMRERNLLILSR